MGCLKIVAIGWGVVVTLIMFTGGFGDHVSYVSVLAYSWVPLVAIIAVEKSNKNTLHILKEKLSNAANNPDPKLIHVEGKTGIAVNTERQEITLVNDAVIKTYPFSDIRNWERKSETAALIHGGGTQALGANVGAGMKAARNSGLFVQVKDIDYPEWRVQMADINIQKRWFEILTQILNEGRTAM